MADLNDPLPGAGVSFWSIMAALAGSLLTFRFLVDARPWTRFWAGASSFTTAFFAGPYIAEVLGFTTPKGERFVMLVVSTVGVNLVAGAWTFSVKWREDPQAATAWLLSILPQLRRP